MFASNLDLHIEIDNGRRLKMKQDDERNVFSTVIFGRHHGLVDSRDISISHNMTMDIFLFT
jgi:hypothetical protein